MKRKVKLYAKYQYGFEGNNSMECLVIKETKDKFYVRELIYQFKKHSEYFCVPEYEKPKVPYGEIKIFIKNNLMGWEYLK